MHKDVPAAQLRVAYCLHAAKKYDEAVALLNAAAGDVQGSGAARRGAAADRPQPGRSEAAAGGSDGVPRRRGRKAGLGTRRRGSLRAGDRAVRSQNDLPAAVVELAQSQHAFPEERLPRPRAVSAGGDRVRPEAVRRGRQALPAGAGRVAQERRRAPLPVRNRRVALRKGGRRQRRRRAVEAAHGRLRRRRSPAARLYLRGLCQHRMQKFAEAAQDLQKFLDAQAGGERSARGAVRARVWRRRDSKQYPQAAATFAALLQAKPDFKDADKVTYELAFAYVENKQEKEAAQAFEQLGREVSRTARSPRGAGSASASCTRRRTSSKTPRRRSPRGSRRRKSRSCANRSPTSSAAAQYSRKQYAAAVLTLDALLKEHPQGKLVSRRRPGWPAESQYRLAKFDAALPLFQKVVASPAEKYHARAPVPLRRLCGEPQAVAAEPAVLPDAARQACEVRAAERGPLRRRASRCRTSRSSRRPGKPTSR